MWTRELGRYAVHVYRFSRRRYGAGAMLDRDPAIGSGTASVGILGRGFAVSWGPRSWRS